MKEAKKKKYGFFKVLGEGVKAVRESYSWRGIKKHAMLYPFVLPSLFMILLLNLGSSFGVVISPFRITIS